MAVSQHGSGPLAGAFLVAAFLCFLAGEARPRWRVS